MPKNREDKEKHNDDQKNTDGDAVKEEEEEDDEESSSGDEENDATGYVHAWTSRQKKHLFGCTKGHTPFVWIRWAATKFSAACHALQESEQEIRRRRKIERTITKTR